MDIHDPRDATIAALRQELQRRTDENDDLRYLLTRQTFGPKDDDEKWMIATWKHKLTPAEAIILRLLHARTMVTREQIYEAMYALRVDREWPDPKIIDVWICKIRAKLPRKDFIQTVWGRGYKLNPTGKEWVGSLIEDGRIDAAA